MERYLIENVFGISGLNIAWYGVIIATAVLTGILLALYRCKYTGIDKNNIYDLAILLIPICIICARAYYVVFEWDYYKYNIGSILAINEGGLAIYGAVLGGIIVSFLFCHKRKISFLELADTLIPSLVLGQAIGRWGNFFNQEAFGNLITNKNWQFFPYGVYIDYLKEWHQATFFYESSLNIILLIIMLIWERKSEKKGYLLSFYMIGYGIIRFFIEGLRADSLYLFDILRISQVISIVFIIMGIFILIIIKKKSLLKEK